MKTCFIFIFFILLGIGIPVHAQHLDEIVFGDEVSEMQHGLTTYSPSKTAISSGGLLNQTSRFFFLIQRILFKAHIQEYMVEK